MRYREAPALTKKLIIAGLACLLFLAGCDQNNQNPDPTPQGTVSLDDVRGVIVGKDYDPEKSKYVRKCARKYTTGARKGKCADYKTEKVVLELENWDITVRNDADGQEYEIDVPNYVYEAVNVGDRWPA